MADRYWVGGSGSNKNWNDANGWSATSGGASGASVPTSADNVFIHEPTNGGSIRFNSTVGQAYCRDLDYNRLAFSGTTRIPTGIFIYGGLSDVTVNCEITDPVFKATTTGHHIDADPLLGTITFDGVGGGWIFDGDLHDFSNPTGPIVLKAGHIDLGGFDIKCMTFTTSGSDTKRLTVGAGALLIDPVGGTAALTLGGSNLTIDSYAGTISLGGDGSEITSFGHDLDQITSDSSLTINDASTIESLVATNSVDVLETCDFGSFTCSSNVTLRASNTFDSFTVTGSSGVKLYDDQTISGALTLTGTSAASRITFYSADIVPVTVSAGSVSLSNTDFDSITAAGAIPWSGTSLGNWDRNTNITFVTSTRYWVGNGGLWTSTTKWSTSSGGASGASVPLAQDIVIFDANSITSAGQTITAETAVLGYDVSFAGVLNNPTITQNAGSQLLPRVFHSVTLASGMVKHSRFRGLYFCGDRDMTLTTNGMSADLEIGVQLLRKLDPAFDDVISNDLWTGKLTFLDDVLMTENSYLSVSYGSFDANDFDATFGGIGFDGTSNDTWDMGAGLWTLYFDLQLQQNIEGMPVFIGSNATYVLNVSNDFGEFDFWSNIEASFGPTTVTVGAGVGGELFFIDNGSSQPPMPDLTFASFTIEGDDLFVYWSAGTTYNLGEFVANGSAGHLLTFDSVITEDEAPAFFEQTFLNATSNTLSYIDVANNYAQGTIPFMNCPGGVDSGNNVNWVFNGCLPKYPPSLITCVQRVQQYFPFPSFVFGGLGGDDSNDYKLFKRSTSHEFALWRSPVYRINQDFDVMSIVFPLQVDITDGTRIVPKLYFDDGVRTSTGTEINLTNYSNDNKLIQLNAKDFGNNVRGEANFFLELQFLGEDLAVVGLPMTIDLDVLET